MNKPTTLCPTHGKFPTQCGCSDEQIRRVLQESLPDKQKPVPSLSVTEAHPEEEEPLREAAEDLRDYLTSRAPDGFDIPDEVWEPFRKALWKKEASSEPVKPPRQMELSGLSDEQLNIKVSKLLGWKFANGKWWHDHLGDGPPADFCKMLSREQVIMWIEGLLAAKQNKRAAAMARDDVDRREQDLGERGGQP